MEEFCLINKDRSRIKVFKPFEDVLKPNPTINAMEIAYGCIYKRASKPVIKGSRVESIEDARKEYKKLLDEGWKKTKLFKSYFQEIFEDTRACPRPLTQYEKLRNKKDSLGKSI